MREPTWTVAGRKVLLSDWQAESEADWGDRSLTGKLPRSVTWAEQQAPIVGWVGTTPIWSGKLTADPRDEGDLLSIRAHGNARDIEAATAPLLYRLDGAEHFTDATADPHGYTDSEKYDIQQLPSLLTWAWGDNSTDFASGNQAGFVAWLEGAVITRYSFRRIISLVTPNFEIATHRATGPTGTFTAITTHALDASADATVSSDITSPQDMLNIRLTATGTATDPPKRKLRVRELKLYGRTTDDAFSASAVVADVGADVGLDTSGVQNSSLAVLPLYWTETHPALLDYMAELTDWRWLVTHEGLSFGPWGATWETATSRGAAPSLEPIPRANRFVQPYRSVAGAPLAITATPASDPFPGEVVAVFGEELEDPQPNSALAEAVAVAQAEYHASHRLQGSVDLTAVRYRGAAQDPMEVMAGDQLLLTDLAPTIGPQRIRRVTKRSGAVTVELGETFNIVKAVNDLQRDLAKRRRKKRRKR